MGGTEIDGPLMSIFTQEVPNMQKRIFLLTDGAVDNTDEVVQII